MKILLDTCVHGSVFKELQTCGFDVIWSGNWAEDPGDEEILATAHKEDRILVTLDKDFGELAIVKKQHHCGILRLVSLSSSQQKTVCKEVLANYGSDLQRGAIITAELGRVRIRLQE
jgi:predicted nuclease of predicted toxin-antitoxin system